MWLNVASDAANLASDAADVSDDVVEIYGEVNQCNGGGQFQRWWGMVDNYHRKA